MRKFQSKTNILIRILPVEELNLKTLQDRAETGHWDEASLRIGLYLFELDKKHIQGGRSPVCVPKTWKGHQNLPRLGGRHNSMTQC